MPATLQFVTFAADDVANAFAGLSEAELDGISFGVIQVDAAGTILLYNEAEAAIAGRPKKAAIGRNFFTEVAVCTNVSGFRGRFDAGVAAGNLNVVFEWHLHGPDRPRVLVHLKQAERGGHYWISTKRL